MMKGAIPLSRAKILAICALAIAAAGTVFLLLATANGGTASATSVTPVTQSDYSALNSGSAGDASASAPPSASANEGDVPIAGSMTKLPVGKAGLSVTIAKSSEGGVCVFLERSGAQGAGGSCAPASQLKTGATAQVREASNGEITVAGVVPDGVSSVKVAFTNGTSQTVPVVGNGWVIENAPAGITSASGVVGG